MLQTISETWLLVGSTLYILYVGVQAVLEFPQRICLVLLEIEPSVLRRLTVECASIRFT